MAVTLKTDRPTKEQILDGSPNRYNQAKSYSGVSLSSDGVNDYTDVGDTSQTIKTVIVWIKPDTTTESILDLDGGTHYINISSGTVTATGFASPTVYVDGYTDNIVIEANVWYMIAVTTATGIDADDVDFGRVGATYFGGEMSNVIFGIPVFTAVQIQEIWNDPSRPLATGLESTDIAGWWPLFEDDTYFAKAFDYSGNGNDGTITGATYNQGIKGILQTATGGEHVCVFNATRSFKGSGLSISTDAMTQVIWCYNDNVSSTNFFFDFTNFSAQSRILATGTIELYHHQSGGASSGLQYFSALSVGFNMIVITYDNNGTTPQRLFVNGVEKSNSTGTPTSLGTLETINDMWIGSSRVLTLPFKGIIFYMAHYNRALTPDEITALYNDGDILDPRANTGNYESASELNLLYVNAGTTMEEVTGNGSTATIAMGTPSLMKQRKGLRTGYTALNSLPFDKKTLFLNGNEYAIAPHNESLNITTALTLSAWYRFESTGSQETIIAKSLSYELAKGSAEAVIGSFYQTTNQTHITTTTLSINTWYYLVMVYDGANLMVYIDGVFDSQTAKTGAIDSTTAGLEIGRNNSSTYTSGEIDEAKVYNRALTAQEVLQNYRAGLANHTN